MSCFGFYEAAFKEGHLSEEAHSFSTVARNNENDKNVNMLSFEISFCWFGISFHNKQTLEMDRQSIINSTRVIISSLNGSIFPFPSLAPMYPHLTLLAKDLGISGSHSDSWLLLEFLIADSEEQLRVLLDHHTVSATLVPAQKQSTILTEIVSLGNFLLYLGQIDEFCELPKF